MKQNMQFYVYLFLATIFIEIDLCRNLYAQNEASPSPYLDNIILNYDLKPASAATPKEVVQELFDLYKNAGNEEYIGEDVSQLEHALQAAQQAMYAFDKNIGIDEENIIAALFHDIGHRYKGKEVKQMNEFGVVDHDKIGAALLATRGFSSKVVTLVGGHVDAKRYKVFKDKNYQDKLTYASRQTLIHQGGPMSDEEASEFEKNIYFKQVLLLRDWEEKAKMPKAQTPPLEYFRDMILRHLENNISNTQNE